MSSKTDSFRIPTKDIEWQAIRASGAGRTQERNRRDALERLTAFIESCLKQPKHRIKTKPSRASQKRRMDKKTKHGKNKALRRKPVDY